MFDLQYSAKKPNGLTPILEMPATASTAYKVGEALILSSGALVAATGTNKPTYICAEDYTAPASGARKVRVVQIDPGMIFKTTINATPTNVVVGDVVTLHTDGMCVTATETNGVATVVDMLGTTAANGEILVRFA